MPRLAYLAFSAALLTWGCGSADPVPMPPIAAPTTAPAYVALAGAGDMFEIQSSQVALQKAQNPDVRRFAQMMVDHHSMTSRDLMDAATRAGVPPPPPTLPPDKAQRVAALQNATSGFDGMYMREQVMAHQEALAVHRGYSRQGDNSILRGAASKTAPIVRRHLNRATRIAGRL